MWQEQVTVLAAVVIMHRLCILIVILIGGVGVVACGTSTSSPLLSRDATEPPRQERVAPEVPAAPVADAGPDGRVEHTVKVLVLNVLHGYPDFEALAERTAMIAELTAAEQPDFVLAQEIHQSATTENRASQIAKKTGYEWAWKKASGVPGVFEEGPAILSRWPIVWRGGVVLPHTTNFGLATRVLCAARAATPWGEIFLYSFHLETAPDSVNADQAKAALEFVQTNPSALPSFLGGDTNATPEKPSMRMLRGEATYLGATGDFADAWVTIRPNDPGLTEPNPNPTARIDYLFVVPGSKGSGVVKSCERVLDQPKNGVYASDHLGLLCTVTLP